MNDNGPAEAVGYMTAVHPTCASCSFWVEAGRLRGTVAGECRRIAPAPALEPGILGILGLSRGTHRFPVTRAIDWCGMHQTHP